MSILSARPHEDTAAPLGSLKRFSKLIQTPMRAAGIRYPRKPDHGEAPSRRSRLARLARPKRSVFSKETRTCCCAKLLISPERSNRQTSAALWVAERTRCSQGEALPHRSTSARLARWKRSGFSKETRKSCCAKSVILRERLNKQIGATLWVLMRTRYAQGKDPSNRTRWRNGRASLAAPASCITQPERPDANPLVGHLVVREQTRT
jgi:hypothetical protein